MAKSNAFPAELLEPIFGYRFGICLLKVISSFPAPVFPLRMDYMVHNTELITSRLEVDTRRDVRREGEDKANFRHMKERCLITLNYAMH